MGHCDGRLGQPQEGAQAFDAVLTVRNSLKAFLHCGSPRLKQQRGSCFAATDHDMQCWDIHQISFGLCRGLWNCRCRGLTL